MFQKAEFEDGIDVLVNMFPEVTLGNIKRALSLAAGHLDLAVDSLLEGEQRCANKKVNKTTLQVCQTTQLSELPARYF